MFYMEMKRRNKFRGAAGSRQGGLWVAQEQPQPAWGSPHCPQVLPWHLQELCQHGEWVAHPKGQTHPCCVPRGTIHHHPSRSRRSVFQMPHVKLCGPFLSVEQYSGAPPFTCSSGAYPDLQVTGGIICVGRWQNHRGISFPSQQLPSSLICCFLLFLS